MRKLAYGSKRLASAVVTLCLVWLTAGAAVLPVSAAGQGYSDVFRMYTLSGIGEQPEISAMALVYGSAANAPKDNYAVVVKYRSGRDDMLVDIIDGASLDILLDSCLQTTRTEVDRFNEYMLERGAPDELLLLEEKPPIVDEILAAAAAGKSSVRVRDTMILSPDALRLAAQKGGPGFRLQCDTMEGKAVGVRITVNPSAATKGVVPVAFPDKEAAARYEKKYDNQFAVLQFLQEGSFGTAVGVAARLDLKLLNTKSLHFYSLNPITNQYTLVENTGYSLDDKGYLTFTTTHGGTMLITDKPLKKK